MYIERVPYQDDLPSIDNMYQLQDQIKELKTSADLEEFAKYMISLSREWSKTVEKYTDEGEYIETTDVAADRYSKLSLLGGSIKAIMEGLVDKAKFIYYNEMEKMVDGKKVTDKRIEMWVNDKCAGIKSALIMTDTIMADVKSRYYSLRSNKKW